MKAIVRECYGGPEVLELREVPAPRPGPGEVLVRVRASSVNMADVDYITGKPWATRFGTGLRAPKAPIPGIDMAGEVVEVGSGTKRFSPGDRVMADLFEEGSGAWAEYVVVSEAALTPIADGVRLEIAGVTPSAGVFGLQGIRDKRPVQPGDRVLVNGASGNIGPFAVQIAKSFGAEVTGVCRTEKMHVVRALGADHVIDHTAEDYRASGERYDLILDIAGRGGVIGLRGSIERGGGYVVIGANGRGYVESILLAPFIGLATGRKMGLLMWRVNDTKDMADLAAMLADGRVYPHIDSSYPLEGVPEALARVQAGDFIGKIAISI